MVFFRRDSWLTARVSKCALCMYGKVTNGHGGPNRPTVAKIGKSTITAPGQCISVDQLQSPTPGLIVKMKGIPTTQRYTVSTPAPLLTISADCHTSTFSAALSCLMTLWRQKHRSTGIVKDMLVWSSCMITQTMLGDSQTYFSCKTLLIRNNQSCTVVWMPIFKMVWPKSVFRTYRTLCTLHYCMHSHCGTRRYQIIYGLLLCGWQMNEEYAVFHFGQKK